MKPQSDKVTWVEPCPQCHRRFIHAYNCTVGTLKESYAAYLARQNQK